MGLFKNLVTRFKQQCETGDGHSDGELKTHYYKANRDKVMAAAEEMFIDKQTYKVQSVSKEHGEMLVENKKSGITLVVTIVSPRPIETAVDFTASSDKFRPAGAYPALKKEIMGIYSRLDAKLPAAGK